MSQSDEQAPDGASETANTQPPSEDYVPRTEAQKAFEARDKYKREARELKAKLAELEGRAKPDPKGAAPSDGNEPPAWARAIIEQQQALAAKLEGKEKGERRARVVETILGRVPEANRNAAGLILDGLVARGQVSLDGDNIGAIVDAAAKALKTSHGDLFRLPGSANSALQIGPDGQIDWSTVKTAADVPPDAWGTMPDEVLDRVMGGGRTGKGGGGGILFGGG